MGVTALVSRLRRTITWIEALGYVDVALFLVFLVVLGTWRIPESAQLVATSVVTGPDAWTLIVEADPPAAGILERGRGHAVSFAFDTGTAPLTGQLATVENVAHRVYRLIVLVEPGLRAPATPPLPARLQTRVLSSTFVQIFLRRA